MSTLSIPFLSASEKTSSKPSRLRGLVSGLVREIRIRQALREVGSLDDAALLDLGVSRGGIEDVVRHGRTCECMA